MALNNIKPDIRFLKNGVIELSSRVTNLLNIQNGDVINFDFDGIETYLYLDVKNPCTGSYKGICRSSKNNGRHMRVYWADAVKHITHPCGTQQAYYRVGDPVERCGKKMLPIITRINLYQK